MNDLSPAELETIVAAIKASKKYRHTYEGTIRRLVEIESQRHRTRKQVERAARKRLHTIVASYLGDPDYAAAQAELEAAFAGENAGQIANMPHNFSEQDGAKEACARVLARHATTRERLSILDRFYGEIFRRTGEPRAVLDLACGLNPLTFPWMELPATVAYHAYDVHEQRVAFVNAFFALQGLESLARVQDVAFETPQEQGDVAFFFKELHRFERNYEGRGLALLEALRVRYVVVSFPTVSLHGGHQLTDHYRRVFGDLLSGKDWAVDEIVFENELVFCVDKGAVD